MFRFLCAKGVYPNGIIDVNKVFNVWRAALNGIVEKIS